MKFTIVVEAEIVVVATSVVSQLTVVDALDAYPMTRGTIAPVTASDPVTVVVARKPAPDDVNPVVDAFARVDLPLTYSAPERDRFVPDALLKFICPLKVFVAV